MNIGQITIYTGRSLKEKKMVISGSGAIGTRSSSGVMNEALIQ